MLDNIHRSLLASRGLFLLALVFPLYQYVEYKPNHEPEQILHIEGETFEHQVASFYERVLQPAGFELIRWTKLPYLCEGNIDLTYFWLIDAVFLLKAVDCVPTASTSSVSSSKSGCCRSGCNCDGWRPKTRDQIALILSQSAIHF